MRGRAERLDLERQRLGRRRQLGQLGAEREQDPLGIRAGVAQRDRDAPGAAGHEARRHGQRPQRAPAPLAPGEHAGHEQLQRPLELLPGRGLGQVEPLGHRLGRPARVEREVTPLREVVREQARVAEPLGHRARGQRGDLAERADAEPLEDLRQRLQLGPAAQQRDRQRREEVAHAALLHHVRAPAPAGPHLQRRRVGGEAARPAPKRAPGPSTRRASASTPARPPPCRPCSPADSK